MRFHNRYPGQEAGDSKIPTVIYYDENGKVVSVGDSDPQCEDETEITELR